MAKPKEETKKERYFEAKGGRKTAVARARVFSVEGGSASGGKTKKGVVVNDKDVKEYFKSPKHQHEAVSPLTLLDLSDKLGITVRVRGGGIHAQAHAVRHAVAMALVKLDPELKKRLRRAGYVTRDARMVERKKYGLKKARRAPQWKKR